MPPARGIWTPSNTPYGLHPSQHPEGHHDWFNRFCRAHNRYRPTDPHATPSVAIGRIYAVLRCRLIIISKCVTRKMKSPEMRQFRQETAKGQIPLRYLARTSSRAGLRAGLRSDRELVVDLLASMIA